MGFKDENGNDVYDMQLTTRLLDVMIHGCEMYSDEYIQSVFDIVCVHLKKSALYDYSNEAQKAIKEVKEVPALSRKSLPDVYNMMVDLFLYSTEIYCSGTRDRDEEYYDDLVENRTFVKLIRKYIPDKIIADKMIANMIDDTCEIIFIGRDADSGILRTFNSDSGTEIVKSNNDCTATLQGTIKGNKGGQISEWKYVLVKKSSRIIWGQKYDDEVAYDGKTLEIDIVLGLNK